MKFCKTKRPMAFILVCAMVLSLLMGFAAPLTVSANPTLLRQELPGSAAAGLGGAGWRLYSDGHLVIIGGETPASRTINVTWDTATVIHPWSTGIPNMPNNQITQVTIRDNNMIGGAGLTGLFRGMTSVTHINGLERIDTAATISMASMFEDTHNLVYANVGSWNTANVDTMHRLFYNARSIQTLNVANWNTSAVTNMNGVFGHTHNLPTLDVSAWNVSSVTTMATMFVGVARDAAQPINLNVAGWNVGSVTNMSQMFNSANIVNPIVDNWDVSNVTTMSAMFQGATITALNLSNWNVGNVTTMLQMFQNAHYLTTIGDVSGWETGNVTSMGSMFSNTHGLTHVDVSGWDVTSVLAGMGAPGASQMFDNAHSLTFLDFSGWYTRPPLVPNISMANMLRDTNGLRRIALGSNFYIRAGNPQLPAANHINSPVYTGYWVFVEDNSDVWRLHNGQVQTRNSAQAAGTGLMQGGAAGRTATPAGHWIWQQRIPIVTQANRSTSVNQPQVQGIHTVEQDQPNDTGYIYVTFPPGTAHNIFDITLPSTAWTYTVATAPNGDVVVTITPPAFLYPPEGALVVTVVEDDSSDPIENASVRVYMYDDGQWMPAGQGNTNAAGQVYFGLPVGEHRIVVNAPGYTPANYTRDGIVVVDNGPANEEVRLTRLYTPEAILTIYKDLRLPPGTDMPTDDLAFYFTGEFLPSEFWPPVASPPQNVLLAPQSTQIRIPFTYDMYEDYATGVTVGSVVYSSITASTTIDLNAVAWPRPGIYTFRIRETANTSGLDGVDGKTMDYDPTLFYLVVHVVFPDGDFTRPLQVSFFGVSHSRTPHENFPACPGLLDAAGNPLASCDCVWNFFDTPSADPRKPRDMTFVNYFRRPPANTYFQVSKTVTGDMVDPHSPFPFSVEFTLPQDTPLPHTITISAEGYNRNAANDAFADPRSRGPVTGLAATITINPGGSLIVTHGSFNLRHGDVITFANMPIGTTYTVTEANAPNFTQIGLPTIGGAAYENGRVTVGLDSTAALVVGGSIAELAPGATGRTVFNYVSVTNDYYTPAPMGIFLQNAPFGLMVGLAVGALGLTATAAIAYGKAKTRK